MREILFFIIGAYVSGTIFMVALIELIFTVKRRKSNAALEKAMKEIRSHYNQSINKLVLTSDAQIEEVEKKTEGFDTQLEEEKKAVETVYQAKIDELTEESKKALDSAKAKAKKLQEEAKMQADEYMKLRQKEVEEDLMNLVIAVSRKVLPEGLSYEAQKSVVMKAFEDVQTEHGKKGGA